MPRNRRLLTLIFSALLLAACAGPSRHEHEAAARAEALRNAGYQASRQATTTLALQRWIVRGEPLAVDLVSADAGPPELPLIVYLPGMGEPAAAGLQWRQAWARAGYAVLSVQPLAADAEAWSSPLARAADFKGLARERRAAAPLRARLEVLQAVLAEARRRGAAGDVLWRRVDFTRLGLAGYELGTQAVLEATNRFGATALLAISPLQATADAARDGLPLLLISAEQDSDPTGLIAEAPASRARAALADGGATGSHYLLTLSAGTHMQLAGSGGDEPEALAERGWRGQAPGGGGRRREGPSAEAPRQHPAAATSAVAIEGASIAFWDATLRGDTRARAWLADGAAPWLRGIAVWDRR